MFVGPGRVGEARLSRKPPRETARAKDTGHILAILLDESCKIIKKGVENREAIWIGHRQEHRFYIGDKVATL